MEISFGIFEHEVFALGAAEFSQHKLMHLHDPAVDDDIFLQFGYFVQSLDVEFKCVLARLRNFVVDIVQDGGTPLKQKFQDAKKQIAGIASHVLIADRIVLADILSQIGKGPDGAVVDGDQIIFADKKIDFCRPDFLGFFVQIREKQNDEMIIVVFVDFGAGRSADDVFKVQRMEMIVAFEVNNISIVRIGDVDPL